MLDPESFGKRVQEHFATVSDEEFIANLKRYNPDLVRELEVQRSSASRWDAVKRNVRSRLAGLFARRPKPTQRVPGGSRRPAVDRTP